ncbi:hypothetical protein COCC4DRAFT_30618, partial [Bipolaris maydis ATCC 48331]
RCSSAESPPPCSVIVRYNMSDGEIKPILRNAKLSCLGESRYKTQKWPDRSR